MTFLLDTNTVSYYLRGDAPVVKRIQALDPREGIASVARAINEPGGFEAVQLRVAEQYVDRFGEIATRWCCPPA